VVEAAGVPFLTGFNRRFDPGFAALRARIAAGDIGAVELVTITVARSGAAAGFLHQEVGRAVPGHDDPRFRHGAVPAGRGVRAPLCHRGRRWSIRPSGRPATWTRRRVILTTASGRICQISNSRRAAYGYDQRIEVHGEKGMLRAENQLETTVEIATERGFRRDPAQHFFLERYEASVSRRDARFVAAATGGTRPEPDIHDGLQAQILADAATRSRETAMPVDLL
jgi:myo-inositol 2-dehydrogenase/D-chiro-inositol 1-dehydrogenase